MAWTPVSESACLRSSAWRSGGAVLRHQSVARGGRRRRGLDGADADPAAGHPGGERLELVARLIELLAQQMVLRREREHDAIALDGDLLRLADHGAEEELFLLRSSSRNASLRSAGGAPPAGVAAGAGDFAVSRRASTARTAAAVPAPAGGAAAAGR